MKEQKIPNFHQSLLCFGGIMTMIIVGVLVFGINMHVLLLISIIWTSLNAYFLGYSFSDIKKIMNGGVSNGIGACYIFILVGIVIAAFIESGTIASLVYYGLDIIHPMIFLPAGLLLCAFMSLAVGTQFGTVATAGVILIGVGSAFGIPLPIIAGMVVSGASFGDKMSPVSDTTNLAAVAAGTDLYKHIKSMLFTTVPTFIICIILYSIIGFEYSSGAFSDVEILGFQNAIESNFNVNVISFLPIVVLLGLSLKKVAAEPAMIASAVTAMLLAIFQQDRSLLDILASFQFGYSAETGYDALDVLVNRGGIQSMMWTFSLALFALILGGLLEKVGFLTVLLKGVLAKAKSAFSVMLATICSGVVSCLSTGDSYFGTIVTSQLFKKKYEEMKLQKYLLSRCVEESTTLSTPIIPWALGGAFVAGTLGVPVLDYLPWAFLNYLNMFVSLGLAYFGFGIFRVTENTKEAQSLE